MTEQIEINKEYFESLTIKKTNLLEKARTAESSQEFIETFDRIVRLNRVQLDLLPQMYPPGRKDG